MAASTIRANLQAAKEAYSEILLLVTLVVSNPTQANVDAVVAAASARTNVVRPKPTYTLEGETYNWQEYQEMIIDKIDVLNRLIQLEASPFIITSRARP